MARVISSITNHPDQPIKWHANRMRVTDGTFKVYMKDVYKKIGKTGIVHLAVWGVLNGYRDGCVCFVEGERVRTRPSGFNGEDTGACH